MLRLSVLLIICRSWVRAPPAPPAASVYSSSAPWTDQATAVQAAALVRPVTLSNCREGSWRAKVYVGKGPLTGRDLRFWKTRKTEVEAQIELGKLLALARKVPAGWSVTFHDAHAAGDQEPLV